MRTPPFLRSNFMLLKCNERCLIDRISQPFAFSSKQHLMNIPGLTNNSSIPSAISGRKLILLIGILGFALPVVLIIISVALESCSIIQGSISAYYFTVSRNVFVGVLCALSICLFVYKGYSKFDEWLANLAGFFSLGVAFFPTSIIAEDCIQQTVPSSIISVIHFISAALLFTAFAIFSLFLFTKSDETKPITQSKLNENRVYRICGYIIIAAILSIFVWMVIMKPENYPQIDKLSPVFWLESIALWAFSVSWLTKSKLFSSNH